MKKIIFTLLFTAIIGNVNSQDIIFDNSSNCTVYYTVFARELTAPNNNCNYYQADQTFSVLPNRSRLFAEFNYTHSMGENWWYGPPYIYQLTPSQIPPYSDLSFDSFKFYFNPNPCNFYNSVGPCTPNPAGVGIACTSCSSSSSTTHLYASYSPFGPNIYVKTYNL